MIGTIVLFLVLLSVLVLAHEFGHYLAARWSGVKVEEFGLGFPPRVASWKGKDGTTWSLNIVPLGGFVKLKGETGDEAERKAPDSFSSQTKAKRLLVLVAGVAMNLVAAAVIFTAGFMIGIPSMVDGDVPGAVLSERGLHIAEVVEGSPADEAGITVGDKIVSIDGTAFTSSDEARNALSADADGAHTVVVERGDDMVTLDVAPAYIDALGREGVGVWLVETANVRYPWYLAPWKGIQTTANATYQIVAAFGGLLASIVGDEPVKADLAGPVGIAVMTGEIARLGLAHLLQFAAMLSINLAVINILPIPALDGGRVAFVLLEAIRRKPVTPRLEQAVHAVGFVLLLGLIVVVTFKDVVGLL